MHPATRDKVKLDGLANSEETATINRDEPLVRQEDTIETDINYLIAKYGYHALLGRPQPVYGEFDYTMTLQDHYHAAAKVRQAYDNLPEHVRERYSREEFFAMLSAGAELDLSEPKEPPKEPENANVTEVTKE